MSYDTSIMADTGGDDLAEVEDIGNYTSNVGRMYRALMPGPYDGGGRYYGSGPSEPCGGLHGLSGLPCSAAAAIIADALQVWDESEDEMIALEPSNGWGTAEGARAYLRRIMDACNEHPTGILGVS